jgi:hypothetical protein
VTIGEKTVAADSTPPTGTEEVSPRVRIRTKDAPEPPPAPDRNGASAHVDRAAVFDVRGVSVFYGAKKALAPFDMKIYRNLVTA